MGKSSKEYFSKVRAFGAWPLRGLARPVAEPAFYPMGGLYNSVGILILPEYVFLLGCDLGRMMGRIWDAM